MRKVIVIFLCLLLFSCSTLSLGYSPIDIENNIPSITNDNSMPIFIHGNILDYDSNMEISVIEQNGKKVGIVVGIINIEAISEEINVPSFINNIPIIAIGPKAFYLCTTIKSVNIPDTVTYIGQEAFSFCLDLDCINIGSGVTSIGEEPFNYCTNLESINVSNDNTAFTSLNGILFDKEMKNLICYPAGKKDKEYHLPDSVTNIDRKSFFLSKLENITVSDTNNYFTALNGVLFDKYVKKLIFYPSYRYETDYTIPNSVKIISEYAFSNCYYLKNINIPRSVIAIFDDAFRNCINLTRITIPNTLKYIGKEAFYGCLKMTSISIPSSVTYIEKKAFFLCCSLENININNGVIEIGDEAFNGCSNLTTINIPSSVTDIGKNAFCDCNNLIEILIDNKKLTISGASWGAPNAKVKWKGEY